MFYRIRHWNIWLGVVAVVVSVGSDGMCVCGFSYFGFYFSLTDTGLCIFVVSFCVQFCWILLFTWFAHFIQVVDFIGVKLFITCLFFDGLNICSDIPLSFLILVIFNFLSWSALRGDNQFYCFFKEKNPAFSFCWFMSIMCLFSIPLILVLIFIIYLILIWV